MEVSTVFPFPCPTFFLEAFATSVEKTQDNVAKG